MKAYAQPIKRLISELSKLPGIGEKTATRLANYILRATEDDVKKLSESIVEVKRKIKFCRVCLNLTETEICHICHDKNRDHAVICVVQEPDAMAAIEESGCFNGTYHVLHGALAPLDGIGPESLHLNELMKRVDNGTIKELIIATNPDVHGEATALLIIKMLKGRNIKITRIATGVPLGGDLKYIDKMTISKSLEFRRGM
ncbi:MAG TPA: recombination mediator RecR [Smithellaceae bacterium]|mgnify:FL=1|jgi:recombination protein RecR|nr:recombination mediator RecR [Smithellaceae bacterium]HOF77092.1 recombination mediator RecR [Smithellaceae bacterium]HOM70268.1 recombination mediator RecR [Smithellaceae bacterium]HOS08205.1 recombination mediator RecR [Smithellaceae bacterium]HPD48816.1 recombination mediator RecR [Smithellaceae bacterium]